MTSVFPFFPPRTAHKNVSSFSPPLTCSAPTDSLSGPSNPSTSSNPERSASATAARDCSICPLRLSASRATVTAISADTASAVELSAGGSCWASCERRAASEACKKGKGGISSVKHVGGVVM